VDDSPLPKTKTKTFKTHSPYYLEKDDFGMLSEAKECRIKQTRLAFGLE
jgi:hypothetical protein